MLDLHNHIIPGVDDGARSLDEAYAALVAMRDDGVTSVLCTPHFDASFTRQRDACTARLEQIDQGWDALVAMARERLPDLELRRGVELRLDTPNPDLDDPRLRLDGGSAVLVEFHGFFVPPGAADALRDLATSGFVPLLAHPERYRAMTPALARSFHDAGAFLQVNAGSLSGRYGSAARDAAWQLLEQSLVSLVASDYHARGATYLPQARARLERHLGEEATRHLMEENPRRLVSGEMPLLVVGRGSARGLLGRLMEWLPGR